MATPVHCFLVRKRPDGTFEAGIAAVADDDLPPGEVTIDVHWSSVNYKDALAARGHPGVARRMPHVPGVDAAGIVHASLVPEVSPGDRVLVTGYELGAGQWGGWSQRIRVPAEWVIPVPPGMSLRTAMALGTAGFTAALATAALQQHGITPGRGQVVVTGATGGVGSLSVSILAALGYQVDAVTGKAERADQLKSWGANQILSREAVLAPDTNRPLSRARWAGAVDTVGGRTLADILRQLTIGGCAAACGLVGGTDLSLTVYPFILRGVSLVGIDSAWCPRSRRLELWQRLAGPWHPPALESLASDCSLEELPARVEAILAGRLVGRTVVRIRNSGETDDHV